MKIFVRVKPNAREDKVQKIDNFHYDVMTQALPINGRANLAVIELLADFLNIPKTNIQIASGLGSRQKVLEVTE